MNLHEIETAITSHTYEETYESTWGPDAGQMVTYTREMGWHELWCESLPDEGVQVSGVGLVEVAETFGGEGEGDTAYVVLRVIEDDGNVRYFRKDGYYASYEGADFDGYLSEVKPVEKIVTVYE